jgi:hypothetical protein
MNIIVPESSQYFPYAYFAEFNAGGLDIELKLVKKEEKAIPDNSTIIPVGIFCFHGAKKEGNAKFEMLSKYYEINDFVESENYKISFPFSAEEIETIENYMNCLFYFGIGEPPKGARRARGYKNGYGIEFSIEDFTKKPVRFGTIRDKELISREE